VSREDIWPGDEGGEEQLAPDDDPEDDDDDEEEEEDPPPVLLVLPLPPPQAASPAITVRAHPVASVRLSRIGPSPLSCRGGAPDE
jgi:hypothetical protein